MKALKNVLYLLVVGIILVLVITAATMVIQLVMDIVGGFSEHTIISVSGTGGTIVTGLLCAVYVKIKKFARTDTKERLNFPDMLNYSLLGAVKKVKPKVRVSHGNGLLGLF